MRYPVGKSRDDFLKNWYSATKFGAQSGNILHEGEDFNLRTGGNTDLGQPVHAFAEGVVSSVHVHTSKPTLGKHVHIRHDALNVWSHYAHLDTVLVKEGQAVKEGQIIGTIGKSGTEYAHLHFCIKNQPTGIDGVAKTKEDLKKWESPIPFIEKSLINPMPETIAVEKSKFEELVKKSTERDELNKVGINSLSDVTELKKSVDEARLERQTAQQEAKQTRETLGSLQKTLADKLQSPQDKDRIISAVDDLILRCDLLQDQADEATKENDTYEKQLTKLLTEINRLQLLMKSNNPLSQAKVSELLFEVVRRMTAIFERKQ